MELEKLAENKPLRNELGQLLPGQTANPLGRPKGKSLKEFAREYLMTLPEDKKLEFLDKLPKDIVWKMAEGNPEQKSETSVNLNINQVLNELIDSPAEEKPQE